MTGFLIHGWNWLMVQQLGVLLITTAQPGLITDQALHACGVRDQL